MGLDRWSGLHRRVSRRTAVRLWATALGLVRAGGWAATGRSPQAPALAGRSLDQDPPVSLAVDSEATSLRASFDAQQGRFGLIGLAAHARAWIRGDAPFDGGLWIEEVRVDDGPALTIDGSEGLELVYHTSAGLELLHSATGLHIALEYLPHPGNAITHRLTLANARPTGEIWIGRAVTLALRLQAGDWTEALAADGTPEAWSTLRQGLPVSYGNHELRSAERGVYPLVRLANADGTGIIVGVSSAAAWRIDLGLDGDRRTLRAGEYQSDLTLRPGEQARLPDVVTIFYRDGPRGAVSDLRRYLQSISTPPPVGWPDTPPAVFNTWFGYGCAIGDDGSEDSQLRYAARLAAQVGVEVLVLDAGWYLGNPTPDLDGSGSPYPDGWEAEGSDEEEPPHGTPRRPLFDFDPGLGTWVEEPAKWQARAGAGGSPASGLRNFSDYVHGLDVRRPDGSAAGKMRFGLWVEPERFDLGLDHSERVLSSSALPGASILDFSRPEVVAGVAAKIQRAIDAYRVDYLKVDANLGLGAEPALGRSGHFWTRWSAGFEELLQNLRQANPSLYIEHCASGLKRYWIGMPRLAHGAWLDDDVGVENVGGLLDAADALLLPRQKTVLVTEDLSRYTRDDVDEDGAPTGELAVAEMREIIRAYWGGERRNGGTIGFSGRLDLWGPQQQRAAGEALETWKRDVRSRG